MATFVIGDIQGCFASFQKLLVQLRFSAAADTLWLVGDLVNRGPHSLEVLQWVKAHRSSVVTVLGNHDLHLLCRYYGFSAEKPGDTLDPVLDSPEAHELTRWLEQLPFVHEDGRYRLVHAGFLPQWSLGEISTLAARAQSWLTTDTRGFLAALRSDQPSELIDAVRVFSRIRTCSATGELHRWDGPPEGAPEGQRPWFLWDHARGDTEVFFGHWAALGTQRGPGWTSTDGGCVWGRNLAAFCIDDGSWFQQPCIDELGRASP